MMRRNYDIEMTRKIEKEGMLMMVTLEAREMTKTGDASSWKGFKLSRTHQPQTTTEHEWRGYNGAMRRGT